jgi:DNA-binding XRE family transcriptional regulator
MRGKFAFKRFVRCVRLITQTQRRRMFRLLWTGPPQRSQPGGSGGIMDREKVKKDHAQDFIDFTRPLVLASAIRGGRAVVGWSQRELATHSKVSLPTIARIESGLVKSKSETISYLLSALARGGVSIRWGMPDAHYVITVEEVRGAEALYPRTT